MPLGICCCISVSFSSILSAIGALRILDNKVSLIRIHLPSFQQLWLFVSRTLIVERRCLRQQGSGNERLG